MNEWTNAVSQTRQHRDALTEFHAHSSHHRIELLASEKCGCFYCVAIYSPAEIVDWTDEDAAGEGQTALCPKCGIDSVVGSKSGAPMTIEFLANMNRRWF